MRHVDDPFPHFVGELRHLVDDHVGNADQGEFHDHGARRRDHRVAGGHHVVVSPGDHANLEPRAGKIGGQVLVLQRRGARQHELKVRHALL